MTRIIPFSILTCSLLANIACAQTTQQAADQPATTQPTEQSIDPAVEAWLDKIEQRAVNIKTLFAKLRYDFIQGIQGDEQRRFGTLVYVAGPPSRFAVHFDRLLVDDTARRQDRWLIFDGSWLVERNDDKKQFFKRQIVPPADGENETPADPLAIGEGPFVVPIGAKKQDILQKFTVEIIDDGDDAPKGTDNTVHLRLTPRPGHRIDFTYIDMWYGKDQLLATRIRTYKEESEDEKIFVLWDTAINSPVNQKDIDTTPPTEPGWDIEITPWGE